MWSRLCPVKSYTQLPVSTPTTATVLSEGQSECSLTTEDEEDADTFQQPRAGDARTSSQCTHSLSRARGGGCTGAADETGPPQSRWGEMRLQGTRARCLSRLGLAAATTWPPSSAVPAAPLTPGLLSTHRPSADIKERGIGRQHTGTPIVHHSCVPHHPGALAV